MGTDCKHVAVTRPGPIPASKAFTARRLWLAVPLVIAWLAGMVAAFWWFEFRPLRPFTRDQAVVFAGEPLRARLASLVATPADPRALPAAATVVHFWDPDCACNRFNEAHVRELMAGYGRHGVRFVVLVRSRGDAAAALRRARRVFNDPAVAEVRLVEPERVPLPSSPAAAVLDAGGGLAYFGPYSVGAVCGVKNGAFVETTLDGLFRGDRRAQLNMLAVGCFCPWQADAVSNPV
jgi:hypothetical protein